MLLFFREEEGDHVTSNNISFVTEGSLKIWNFNKTHRCKIEATDSLARYHICLYKNIAHVKNS